MNESTAGPYYCDGCGKDLSPNGALYCLYVEGRRLCSSCAGVGQRYYSETEVITLLTRVLGLSNRPTSYVYMILDNILRSGYAGVEMGDEST